MDSSALVAIFNDEPEAENFRSAMTDSRWAIGWPTIFETRIWLIRNRPATGSELFEPMLQDDLVERLAFDGPLESMAISAFARFGKGRHQARLNFGDCMAYAVAKQFDLPLLFKGGDFGKTDIKVHPSSVILA